MQNEQLVYLGHMDIKQALQFLDYLIVKKNYTIAEIARQTGVSRGTLYRMLHKKSHELYITASKKLDAMAERIGYLEVLRGNVPFAYKPPESHPIDPKL